jgi:chemotaxis protein methyltransferase CheR
MLISDAEYKDIADLIYRWSGISLGANKRSLVKSRLLKRIRHHKFKSFKEYYEYLLDESHKEELVEFINAISTNVTSFFREEKHFKILSELVLPDIVQRKKREQSRKIRIWSCACATGEEVYSILITLAEYFKGLSAWDIKVLGTDISLKVLAYAKAGVYEVERVKNMPRLLLNKYFDEEWEENNRFYRVKYPLREMAVFGRLNLVGEVFPFSSKPDAVFCRNVMIYFDSKTKQSLIKRIYNCLAEGGYLFTGHSENLLGMDTGFKNIAPAVYKKVGIN